MNIKINILIALFFPLVIISCRKKEDLNVIPPVDLGGGTTVPTAIDIWLRDSLTTPYNIAVKYRWDPWELNLDKTLTPPDESKIITAMSAIKRVWIDPYNQETGSDLFMKKYSPKQFKLVGSVEYNYNGTVLLGQAEGGNNIAFFDINQNFDKDPVSSIKRMIQTSHHEFAHILHQTVLYPQEFRGISAQNGKAGYTSTWYNVDAQDALNNGYITPYSMASADEDFVEMVANMLMEGRTRFNELVSTADEVAQQILKRKEQFVVEYFQNVWSIDFYSLQTRVQAALYNLAPVEAIQDAYGFNKSYAIASVDDVHPTFLPHSTSFKNIYNTAKANVAAYPGRSFALDSFYLVPVRSDTAILAMFISEGQQTYVAQYIYGYSQAGTAYSFNYLGEDDNGAFLKTPVQPLLDYINNTFTLSWYAKPDVTIFPRAKFTPQGTPGSFFYAYLQP